MGNYGYQEMAMEISAVSRRTEGLPCYAASINATNLFTSQIGQGIQDDREQKSGKGVSRIDKGIVGE